MAKAVLNVASEQKPFCKRLLSLAGRHSVWEVWSDFITAFALAISNSVDKAHFDEREAMYRRIMEKYGVKEREVFPLLCADVVYALDQNPEQDFLGSAYMELELGNDHAGQFFTPYDVCRMMAEISASGLVQQVLQEGYVTFNDCACGAGATLIAGCHEAGRRLRLLGRNWQNCVLVTAQDVDFSVGMMCYIQLSLLGAAGYVKIGDSLTDPMAAGDDDGKYWYTPMYFSDVWRYRRIFHRIDKLMGREKDAPGKEKENGSGSCGRSAVL